MIARSLKSAGGPSWRFLASDSSQIGLTSCFGIDPSSSRYSGEGQGDELLVKGSHTYHCCDEASCLLDRRASGNQASTSYSLPASNRIRDFTFQRGFASDGRGDLPEDDTRVGKPADSNGPQSKSNEDQSSSETPLTDVVKANSPVQDKEGQIGINNQQKKPRAGGPSGGRQSRKASTGLSGDQNKDSSRTDPSEEAQPRGLSKASPSGQSTLGRATSTLEAKKLYRQQQVQQRQAENTRLAEQKAAEYALRASQIARNREEEELAEFSKLAPWMTLISNMAFNEDLPEEFVGSYVFTNPELLPEIFERESVKEEQMHPRGGCPNFEDELIYTASEAVMYRDIIRQLITLVESRAQPQLYLTGPKFSGKSLALVCLVNQMRSSGWLVWYIPQALQLTHGGFFHENSPGIWDTPESARLLLKHLKAGNPDRIASLQTSDGKSVSNLIDEAAKHRDSRRVVDLFLEVKDAVCSADEVLIAIDNYQALYQPSEYGEWMSQHHRRVLDPSELRVASAMRLLEQEPLQNGVVVCASSRGGQFSPKLKVPLSRSSLFNIPNMNLKEFQTLARYYMLRGTTEVVSEDAVKKCFFLLGANPKEYKTYAGNHDW